jgi:hypothetical protein
MSDSVGQQGSEKAKARKRSGSEKRARNCVIKFRARKDERDEIRANADAAGLTLGSYLRGLAIARPRTRPVRRPRPGTKIFAQAMGRLGIYASNTHQLLKLANRGDIVYVDELSEAMRNLRDASDELLKVIRG